MPSLCHVFKEKRWSSRLRGLVVQRNDLYVQLMGFKVEEGDTM